MNKHIEMFYDLLKESNLEERDPPPFDEELPRLEGCPITFVAQQPTKEELIKLFEEFIAKFKEKINQGNYKAILWRKKPEYNFEHSFDDEPIHTFKIRFNLI